MGMLYKKTEKGDTKYVPSADERKQRQLEVVNTLGGDGEDFDACLRAVVGMMIDENDTSTEIAFKYYIVCTFNLQYFLIYI